MINKLFNKILLPKYANEINVITSDLADYWERTDDFSVACIRYLQDLNTKYELGFDMNEIDHIVGTVIFTCYTTFDLQNANTMRLFGEFVYYGLFGGKLPCCVRNKREIISFHLRNFEEYVIDNPKPWNDLITKVLDRNKLMQL